MIFTPSIQFPAWLRNGPWPYEAGVSLLLLWLAECVRQEDAQTPRYALQPLIRMAMVEYSEIAVAVCLLGAAALILGLALVASGHHAISRLFRVTGLLTASAIFLFLAVAFYVTWAYSLGGGAYLLLSWRTFCVAHRIGRECRGDA